MKNIIKYLTIAAAATLFVSCFQEKSEIPVYVPATAETNAQVFFKGAPTTQVKLSKENPSLDITVARASTDALSVGITADGEKALTYFNVPATVDFAADVKEATLTISAKDVNNMPMNEFYPLTISISDPTLITAFGTSSFSFEIGVSLPWIVFDEAGTMIEGWWGETEPEMPMKYQQISENLRYCVVEGCWGHDTGPTYNVQPYIWYWNTETNACYIPPQFMGYAPSGGDVYIGDEPAFYNFYYYGAKGDGYVMKNFTLPVVAPSEVGTDAWFAFCDEMRSIYPEDAYPYYDGAGKFYLADYFYLVSRDTHYPTGSGYQFGGTQDVYVCSFAADYTVSLEYQGLFTDKEGVNYAVADVAYEGADVADVAVVMVEGKDPVAAVDILEPEEEPAEEEDPGYVVISEAGSVKLPFAEDAEPGKYTIVAVPINGDGEFEWDYAVYETFQYGPVTDPLGQEYTSADFTAAVDKATLTSTAWDGYGLVLGDAGWAAERTKFGKVGVADIDDAGGTDDLLAISGLSQGYGPYFGFDESVIADLYDGTIYTHKSTNGSFNYQGTDLYIMTQWYDSAGDDVYNVNYALIGAYVAEGLIAFVPYPAYESNYGIVFDGLIFEAFTSSDYSDESDFASLCGLRQILLADPAVYSTPAGVSAAANKALSIRMFDIKSIYSMAKIGVPVVKDWSKDVVASGRVMTANAKSTELKTIE